MRQLTFSYNWNNKLRNICFSTIRIWQPAKYVLSEPYSVYLKDQWLGEAELVKAVPFQYGELTEGMALLDTGYTKAEVRVILQKMYDSYIRQYGEKAGFGFYIFRYQKGEQKQVL